MFVITVIVILFLVKWKEFVDTTTGKKYVYSFNYLNKDIQIIPPISYLDTGSKQLNISGICDVNKNMKIDPEDKECEYHNIQQYQVIKTTQE